MHRKVSEDRALLKYSRALAARFARRLVFIFLLLTVVSGKPAQSVLPSESFDPGRGILLRGTVVTMDDAGTVIRQGNVLVRNKRIIAIWQGRRAPSGTPVDNALEID